jgi:hypothetical protein
MTTSHCSFDDFAVSDRLLAPHEKRGLDTRRAEQIQDRPCAPDPGSIVKRQSNRRSTLKFYEGVRLSQRS